MCNDRDFLQTRIQISQKNGEELKTRTQCDSKIDVVDQQVRAFEIHA